MINCDIFDVGPEGREICKENPRILGNIVYAVRPSSLAIKPKIGNDGLMESWCFDKSNFNLGEKAFTIKVKRFSHNGTGTGVEGPKGFNKSLSFVVDKDLESCSQALRVMKNEGDWYFLVPYGYDGMYIVYGDPVYGTSVNGNFDSGTTVDSDNGITFNISSIGRDCASFYGMAAGDEMPDGSGITTGFIACTKNGTGIHVNEDYYKTFHAIGTYVSGTPSSRIDILPDGALIVVEWSKNPYTSLVDYSIVKPNCISIGFESSTYIDRELTTPAEMRPDGTYVVRRGEHLYTAFTTYFNESILGHILEFQAKCDFSGYVMDKIHTLSPIAAFMNDDVVAVPYSELVLYTDGTGNVSINGTKFGSDYKYAVEVSSPGVVTSGGAIINQPVTSRSMTIYFSTRQYIPGDKIVVKYSNYIFDIPLETE